ncbi:MAG: hypothetical protein C0436_03325 [Alphaproteobacteria bacterium]|nr:hypothetical protein [Alphaproteobacteria bacterium]
MRNAFSLVELSIVLVILGLLTGGILAGQSLIRAAELRSITSDISRYTSATQTFRDKYMAVPGDMNNATRFWARLVNAAHCTTNSAAAVTTPGTCDGDGDGRIEQGPAASQSAEMHQFWRQLALAGLIEGDYTGLAGTGAADHVVIGSNGPRSKISNSGYGAFFDATTPTSTFFMPLANALYFGEQHTTGLPSNGSLKPEEVWNLDTKMDDGRPGIGKFLTFNATTRPNCATTDVASTAEYALTQTGLNCPFFYIAGF